MHSNWLGKSKRRGFAATVRDGGIEPLLLLGEDYRKQFRAVVCNNNFFKKKFLYFSIYLFKVVSFNLHIFNKRGGPQWHSLLNKMPTICISLVKVSSKKMGKMKWFLRP